LEGPSGIGKGDLANRLVKTMRYLKYIDVETKEVNRFELEITADARYIDPTTQNKTT